MKELKLTGIILSFLLSMSTLIAQEYVYEITQPEADKEAKIDYSPSKKQFYGLYWSSPNIAGGKFVNISLNIKKASTETQSGSVYLELYKSSGDYCSDDPITCEVIKSIGKSSSVQNPNGVVKFTFSEEIAIEKKESYYFLIRTENFSKFSVFGSESEKTSATFIRTIATTRDNLGENLSINHFDNPDLHNLYFSMELTYPEDKPKEVTDWDGNVYTTTTIGELEWITDNLKSNRAVDGTGITLLPVAFMNEQNGDEMYMFKHGDGEDLTEADYYNNAYYGPVYNWKSISECDMCPYGWRLPTREDWNKVLRFWYSEEGVGAPGLTYAAKQLRARGDKLWKNNSTATNSTKFSALPGGWLWKGKFYYMGERTAWWAAPENNKRSPFMTKIAEGEKGIWTSRASTNDAMYIRCVKDAGTSLSSNQ